MTISVIKAEKVVAAALGLLERELSLGALVWRQSAADFKGATGDTVTLKLPAYLEANERGLRSATARTKSSLAENKIAVKLTDDIYIDLPISDAELTLDIQEFGGQVLDPVVKAIARKVDDKIAALMAAPKDGAGQSLVYHTTLSHVAATADPYDTAVDARTALNNARVPFADRFIVTGSGLEADFLKSPRFIDASQSGSTATLREGFIGRVAGFEVYTSAALAPTEAYAGHKTAYGLANMAPVVPAGAPWGASQDFNGTAIRTVRVFDPTLVEDRLVADSYMGVSAVVDACRFDAQGRLFPATSALLANDLEVDGGTPTPDTDDAFRLVRAVKIAVS